MAVSSTGVPLFSGVEDLDDMFMATMEEHDAEVMDEVSIAHPVWAYLQRHKLIEYRDSIGTHIPVKIRSKRNPTIKWMSAYDDANSTPSALLDEAKFAYGHLTGRQLYNREELIKNSGEEQLIDLVEMKQEQLIQDLNEEFADTIIGTQAADGRKPMGLGNIMTYDGACGGITPTTAGYEFWNPQQGLKSGGGSYALATEFRDGMRRLYRLISAQGAGKALGKGGNVKGSMGTLGGYVVICGEDLYEAHQKWAESFLKVSLSEIKDSSGWGDFEMFDVNGSTIVYEPSLGAKVGWVMDFKKSIKVRIHSGTNFKFTDWRYLDNKVEVKYRDNLTYVGVYCKSRRANGIITFT